MKEGADDAVEGRIINNPNKVGSFFPSSKTPSSFDQTRRVSASTHSTHSVSLQLINKIFFALSLGVGQLHCTGCSHR